MSVRTKAEQRLQAETLCRVSAVASRMTAQIHVVILSEYIFITKSLLQSICYKLPLMCAKNYQIWLRRIKDRSKNMRWPHFFWPTLYVYSVFQ